MMKGVVVLVLALALASGQVPRTVKGQYRLPARGFAIEVPRDATGFLEGDPAIERGIRIALPSGGNIFVYAEMNALEWRTPAEGVRSTASLHSDCAASSVTSAKVGPLTGAGTRLLCGEDVVRYALAFRPGGGPIYWLRLETKQSQEAAETKEFNRIAASFRVIRWD
jgi:hypothetical protein